MIRLGRSRDRKSSNLLELRIKFLRISLYTSSQVKQKSAKEIKLTVGKLAKTFPIVMRETEAFHTGTVQGAIA
jgi:hypothetical protein